MLIGYARVSTEEQVTNSQIDALCKADCDVIHEEKRSGGNLRRPILEKILSSIQPGDTIVVYKLDRIARSLRDLLTILDRLNSTGAEFRSLTEIIDTRSPAGRMMLQIIGAFAEFERELIRERTKAGMEAAILRGAKVGRPRGMNRKDEAEAVQLWYSGKYSKTAIGRRYGVHISSVKRAILRDQNRRQASLLKEAIFLS
ncbi:MAG: putative site-specific recombinase, invertase Pin [Herminiimonas sp.]|nr:putative site-specific recombinase, invertase Pin [Herminiimonas sp.]